jgi:uncharacterized protein YlaI
MRILTKILHDNEAFENIENKRKNKPIRHFLFTCHECGKSIDIGIEFVEDEFVPNEFIPPVICISCLKKALDMLQKEIE